MFLESPFLFIHAPTSNPGASLSLIFWQCLFGKTPMPYSFESSCVLKHPLFFDEGQTSEEVLLFPFYIVFSFEF